MPVPFGDLQRQYTSLQADLTAAMTRVAASGWYILGAEVAAFEQEFAAACGTAHAVGVASGADALYLALAALGVGPGDEVVTVANACTYQVAAIVQTGALPVLADIDPITHTLDPDAAAAALTSRTRALLPVHLYGRLAPMPALLALAQRHGLAVVEDAAQAHGAWATDASGQPRQAGAWGTCGCFSFYPTKNLGTLGDGGALVTDDAALATRLRQLRQYGWERKYVAASKGGRNSRLDELHAALLRTKLPHLSAWNDARRTRAAWYSELLAGLPLALPPDEPGHVYHLYVVATAAREHLRAHLHAAGIGCDVHYPLLAHQQPAYRDMVRAEPLPHSEHQAARILSLPLFPELSRAEVEQVAAAVRAALSA